MSVGVVVEDQTGPHQFSNVSSVTISFTLPAPKHLTGIIIPLYVYPIPGAWDSVVKAKLAHPSVPFIAVVNPDNGVGASKNQDYVGGIAYLRSNGVKVLGYVDTAYGRRDINQVKAEMDTWISWYPVDGFFFDDVASSGQESYLQALKSHAGGRFCVGNPGTDVPSTYNGILDNLCVYEGAGFPPSVPGGHGSTSAIAYSIPSWDAVGFHNMSGWQGVDYAYVTNANEPNPYGVISPYLMQMAEVLSS